MQTDILLKQLHSSIEELKTAIAKFEKHPSPSTQYTEQLYASLLQSSKLVAAYLVLKEQNDVSPDLNLHLKLMSVPKPEEVEPIVETDVEPPVIEAKEEPIIPERSTKVPEPVVTNGAPRITININDKFRFINELFKANATEYNIAIEQLNAAATIDDSNSYIKGLKAIYEWDDEHEMVKKLISLNEKRFSR